MKESKINDIELTKSINKLSYLANEENKTLTKIVTILTDIPEFYSGNNTTSFYSDSGRLNYYINLISDNRDKCVIILNKVISNYKLTVKQNKNQFEK